MNEKKSNRKNRRVFLLSLSAGLGALGATYRASAGVGPNDKIQMGFIGVGGMGTGRLNEFMRHDDVDVAGICDVDSSHLDRAVAEVEKRREKRPHGYHDFRQLLNRDDVDAVMIATPDHWHALTTITACNAGKDVFVEKPLCHNIAEGRKMVDAALKNKRITQLGTHIHNTTDNYRRVVEMVQSGNLGNITRVHCWKTSDAKKGIGSPENGFPPAELDYDMWLGPAPKQPYNPNRSHFTFRYFWDFSGGIFIDFWCHITDVAYWALDLQDPISVSAVGGRRFREDNTETPDCLDVLYEYPGLSMAWTLHPQPPAFQHMGGIGCIFYGTEATLVANYSQHEIWVDGKKSDDFPRPEPTIPSSPGHIREFLNSIKSREKTTCNVEYAYRLTKGGLLGNIAYRVGERIYWDDQKEQVKSSRKANSLLRRNYRSPWKLV
ncbi:MAG: Gfo/Idh/MocA family oxidoreductase [Candidatus Omnitrophica bacterium]|nr:Gfo/Idh/MocA family oxidoreductase [Candidatus Omnitrophota bacterium]